MPAYNEAKLIREALECIPSFVDHIIVVDDASIDDTAEIAEAPGGGSSWSRTAPIKGSAQQS